METIVENILIMSVPKVLYEICPSVFTVGKMTMPVLQRVEGDMWNTYVRPVSSTNMELLVKLTVARKIVPVDLEYEEREELLAYQRRLRKSIQKDYCTKGMTFDQLKGFHSYE